MKLKNNLIKLLVKETVFQTPLVLWGLIIIIVSFTILIGEIRLHNQITVLFIFNTSFPIAQNGVIWFSYLFWVLALLCIISFPKSLLENIESKRISVILSKSLSRNNFVLQHLLGMIISLYYYMFFAILVFALLGIVKFNFIPVDLLLTLSILPISFTLLLIMLMYIAFVFRSYGFSVLFVLVHWLILSPLLSRRLSILESLDSGNTVLRLFFDILYYSTPQLSEVNNLLLSILNKQSANMHNLIGIIFSTFPISFLLLRYINRKDF